MIPRTMTIWFVAAVPVLIMLFALAMERLENRLRHLTVQENEVEEFLQAARPEEVRVLFGSGIGRALELFRLRRRPRSGPRTSSPGGGSPSGGSPNGGSPNGAGPPNVGLVTSRRTRQRS
jgi:uncharacterized membrane protein YgcG